MLCDEMRCATMYRLLYQMKHEPSTTTSSRAATPAATSVIDKFPQETIITDLDYCKERLEYLYNR